MKIVSIIVIVLISCASFSQQLKAELSPSIIRIGEKITIKYSISDLSSDTRLDFQSFNDFMSSSIRDSSNTKLIEGPKLDIIEKYSENRTDSSWVGTYTVTCWDSATVFILGPKIVIGNKEKQFPDLVFKSELVQAVQGQGMYEIREVNVKLSPKNERESDDRSFLAKNWWWILILGLALAGAIIYFFKRNSSSKIIHELSLREKTILAIDNLEKAKLWETGKLKDHYVELSYILRQYLSARFELSLMELTSTEIKLLLERRNLDRATIQDIAEVLNASDMVKFAKSEPEIYLILKVSALAKQIVIETSPFEFEHAE